MAWDVNIKIEGLDKTIRFLDKLTDLHKLGSPLRKVGTFLVDFYSGEVFDTEGAVYGSPWRPLSERYRIWKARNYPGKGILERTGTMRSSFGFMNTDTFLSVFNPVEYFRKHQLGEDGLPQRIMMQLDETRIDEVVKIVTDGVVDKIQSEIR